MAAGKKITESGKEPTGKEIRRASKSAMKAFNSATDEFVDGVDGLKETFTADKDEAKKQHVYLPAFKVAKDLHDGVKSAKIESIAAEKLAKWLANFDHYREFYKLDELANLQGRMFAEGPIGTAPPRGADEDGEPDMRPDHLRQPGASVTSDAGEAVRDMAAKAGAKMPDGTDPIDKIGRGNPDTKH